MASKRKIIHVGSVDAEASSRRHVLREAGLEVIAAPAGSDVAHLARVHAPDLIVLEPAAVDARVLQSALAAHPGTAGIGVVDLGLDWERLAAQARTSELRLAVCALLRLHATEQALRESDARFRSVADTTPVMIWSSRRDKLRDYFNQPWLYFTGRSPEQEQGEGWAQGLHPEDREQCLATYRRAFDMRQEFEMEYRLRHRDGSYRWVLERGVPRYTPDGIFAGYAGSCLDITERKHIEHALLSSEARAHARAEELEAFMEIAPAAIWIAHDPRCHQVTANRAAYAMMRQAPGTVATATPAEGGWPFAFKVYKGGRELRAQELSLQRAAHTGQEVSEEFDLMFSDGSVTNVIGKAVPLHDGLGKVRGALGAYFDRTKLREVEEALRHSEEQLELATNAAGIGLWFWDLERDDLRWNARCKILFGIDAHETMTYARFLKAVHPDDRERVQAAVQATLNAHAEYDIEMRTRWPDRSVHWIMARGQARSDKHGKARAMMGVAWDITPRKRAEENLRSSERRFRSLIEHSNDLICVFDRDLSVRYVSSSVQRVLGYDSREFLRVAPFAVSYSDDVAALRTAFAEVLANPVQPCNVQHRVRHADGSWRWFEGTITNCLAEPSLQGLVGNFRDITERKSVEVERERLLNAQVSLRELAEASERRSALLAEISDLLTATVDYQPALDALASKGVPMLADCCVIDLIGPDGRLVRAGRSCTFPRVREVFDAYARHVSAGSERDPIVQAAFNGKPVVVEKATLEWMQRTALDPQLMRWFEQLGVHALFAVPLVAYGQRLGALSFLLVDPARRFMLADVHLAQEMASRIALGLRNAMLFAEAESARRQAEEASRVKDEFLATVSHELRQPVHAIGGWVRLLKTGKLPSEKAVHALEMIQQNVGLQGQIVNDLLDVSAIITGQFYLEVQPIGLGSVITSAVEAVRPAAVAKNITLLAQVGELDEVFRGDAKRLQQMVWNLLFNAVKFTPREGRVEVALTRVGDYAQIAVTDNGPGINAEFLPYVFDRFRQQDSTTTRKHGGLGLGLAIVRHVVELHGGRVQVSNVAHGHGAMFVIHLPYGVPAMQPLLAAGARA